MNDIYASSDSAIAADAVLNSYSIAAPPVDVFDIAKREGIEVVYFKPTGDFSDASAILDKDKKIIYLSIEDGAARRAFSLAHELGHYFMKHQANEIGLLLRHAIYADKPKPEKDADLFAAELLMPKKMLKDFIKAYSINTKDDAGVILLARSFGVSRSAMQFRLKSL
jgi:Zn-dependent peptidase ImmA (M78 family)